MDSRTSNRMVFVAFFRAGFALLALAAVVVQLHRSVTVGHFPVVHFFSFFTIQSNLIAIAVLLGGMVGYRKEQHPATDGRSARDLFRGAAVLYMGITGVVYGLLLSGYQEELQTTIPWVDTVLHRLMPLVMAVDWLLNPPSRSSMTFWHCARYWVIYPLAYAVYSLVRGPWVHWYPYPFLDPHLVGGYGTVLLYCLGIAVGSLLFAWLVVVTGRRCRIRVEGG